MKKVVLFIMVMTGVLIGSQQFIAKKNVSCVSPTSSKELFYDLVDLQKKMPILLHKVADLLEQLHIQIEACAHGEKNSCIKSKNINRDICKQAIGKVSGTIDILEAEINNLMIVLHTDNSMSAKKEYQKR